MPGGFGSAYNGTTKTSPSSGGFGAAFNSLADQPPEPPPTPEKKKHGTLLGNLVRGAEHTVEATGVGVGHLTYNLATHPVRTVKRTPKTVKKAAVAFGKSEAHSWSPAVTALKHSLKEDYFAATGNLDAAHAEQAKARHDAALWYARFHADPFAPLLDLATVVSGGTARLGALATLPEKATAREVAAAVVRGHTAGDLGEIRVRSGHETGENTVVRVLPRNAARAGRMKATDAMLKKLSPDTPLVGEFARAARADRTAASKVLLRGKAIPELIDYMKARGKLDKWEAAAVAMRTRLPNPLDLQQHIGNLLSKGTPDSLKQAAFLRSAEFQKAYHDLSPNSKATLEAGRALSVIREQNLAVAGHDVAELADSPYRHMRVARGARYEHDLGGLFKTKEGDVVRVTDRSATGKLTVDVLRNDGKLEVRQIPEKDLAAPLASTKDAPFFHRAALEKKGRLVGGPTVEELKAELDAGGHPHPYYIPDALDAPGPLARRLNTSGGLTPPASDLHVWQGTLFRTGLLALHPDMIGPAYIRSLVYSHGLELHDLARSHATPVEKGAELPAGYVWLREKRGQAIPFLETHVGEHRANVDEAYGDIHDAFGDFTTKDDSPDIAVNPKGQRLAVPKTYADALKVEARNASNVGKWLWAKPTQFWRALVLNLRVPWLENNVLGNHILLAMRFAGVDGMRGYLNALREVRGVKSVTDLLRLPVMRRGLTDAEVREFAPQHAKAGTYIGSQLPTGITSNLPKPVRAALKGPGAVVGFLPKLDRASEGMLRRAGLNAALGPEARTVYRSMPKETRDWHAAYVKAAEDPAAIMEAGRQVEDALGNFLSLTAAEQNKVRALVPFYAWFREITRIALKLPLDAPGRTALIAHLAQAAPSQDDLPSYYRGNAVVGKRGNLLEMLTSRSALPYSTVLDLARGAGAFGRSDRTGANTVLGALNPLVGVPLAGLGQAAFGYGGSPAGSLQAMLLGLPEAKPVVGDPASASFPTRTREDLLAQLLGDPRRFPNPATLAQYAKEGR